MTLKEFLNKNLDIGKCCILMFDENGEVLPIEYERTKDISIKLLKMDYMEHNIEDDLVEIWIR